MSSVVSPAPSGPLGRALRRRPLVAIVVLAVSVVATLAAPAQAERSGRAEARLLSLMERERAAAGAPAWERADDLTAIAARWSARQAEEFGAQGGQRHNPRLAQDVCCYRRVAENVGWASGGGTDLDGAIDRLHAAFMASDGHRANILASAHQQVGVGVELHASGNVYVTVVFREPDASAPSGAGSAGPTTEDPAPAPSRSEDPAPAPPAAADASEPAASEATTAQASAASGPRPGTSVPDDAAADADRDASSADGSEDLATDPGTAGDAVPEPDLDELWGLVREARAARDAQLAEDVRAELDRLRSTLEDGTLGRLVAALRWAFGLDDDR